MTPLHSFIQTLIIAIDWAFGLVVLALTLWLIASKAIRNAVERHLRRRQQIFEKRLERALFQDPRAWTDIKLEVWGDRQVLWKNFAHVAENFSGDITVMMTQRLEELGFLQDAISRLHSRWWWVRAEAAYQIGLLKDPATEAPLLQALNDESEDVALAASRALARAYGCHAFPPILARYAEQWGAPSLDIASVLFEMGPDASPYLIRILPTVSRGSSLLAIDILGYFKDPHSIAPLQKLLTSEDNEVRSRSVKALGQIGHPSALPSVILATEDADPTVRMLACGALGHWVGKESIKALVSRLEDSDLQVRLRAAHTLTLMGTAGNRALAGARRKVTPYMRELMGKFILPEQAAR